MDNWKAISLWQPWASAIAVGAKFIETRSWATDYTGPLLIHAAKRCVQREMRDFASDSPFIAALAPILPRDLYGRLHKYLPFGALVAVCNLVDCVPVEQLDVSRLDDPNWHEGLSWTERDLGDYSPGRFGWVLENVKPFKSPIPYKGAQGLFDVPYSVIHQPLSEIAACATK